MVANEPPKAVVAANINNNQYRFTCVDAVTNLLKSAIILCLFLSISLLLYSSSSSSSSSPFFIINPNLHWLSSSSSSFSSDPSFFSTCQSIDNDNDDKTPTNISHIFFSLAGSATTFPTRHNYTDLWWKHNTTRGYIWLDKSPPSNYSHPTTSPLYRISSPLPTTNSHFSNRIARIVKESFDLHPNNIRWFVFGDDDTIFFFKNLVTVLSKYNHRQMYYIGDTSESVEQVEMHSYHTAFGGGGFAISHKLACYISTTIDGCLTRYESFWGSDEKISACIGELGIHLTKESGFHQLDIRGDPYGLLSSHPITPLISLHHLPSLTPLFPNQTRIQSIQTLIQQPYKLDPSRILQQSICHDMRRKWSVSISWGYTVQLYPSILSSRELELPLRTFKTWRSWGNGPFTFNTRPWRDDDVCMQPILYFLDRVHKIGDGRSLTRYKQVEPIDGKKNYCKKKVYKYASGVKFISVLADKMDPVKQWLTTTSSPRRQCCEMRNGGWLFLQKNMQVVVRNCNPGETVTT